MQYLIEAGILSIMALYGTDHRAMSKRAGVAIAYSSPQNVMLLLNGELFCDCPLVSDFFLATPPCSRQANTLEC
jgi:hypothetical protein